MAVDPKYIPSVPENLQIGSNGNELNKQLKGKLRKVTQGGPQAVICNAILAEYQYAVKTLDTLTLPVQIALERIKGAMSLYDPSWYNAANQGMNQIGNGIGNMNPQTTMNGSQAELADVMTKACPDIANVIPDSLNKTISEFKELGGMVGGAALTCAKQFGSDVLTSLKKLTGGMKTDALDGLLGAAKDILITPFVAIETFLEEAGVAKLLNILKMAEACLTKKGLCDFDRKVFIKPGTTQTYYEYYSNLFCVNEKGEFDLKKLSDVNMQHADQIETLYKKYQKIAS